LSAYLHSKSLRLKIEFVYATSTSRFRTGRIPSFVLCGVRNTEFTPAHRSSSSQAFSFLSGGDFPFLTSPAHRYHHHHPLPSAFFSGTSNLIAVIFKNVARSSISATSFAKMAPLSRTANHRRPVNGNSIKSLAAPVRDRSIERLFFPEMADSPPEAPVGKGLVGWRQWVRFLGLVSGVSIVFISVSPKFDGCPFSFPFPVVCPRRTVYIRSDAHPLASNNQASSPLSTSSSNSAPRFQSQHYGDEDGGHRCQVPGQQGRQR
jgi:hypothetical protein